MMSSPFAHAHFKQCLIGNVKHGDGFDSLTFDVLNKNGEPLNKISVCNRDTQKDLEQLLANPTIRLFWAYEMTDIDISQMAVDISLIEWSPCDGIHHEYEVSRTELFTQCRNLTSKMAYSIILLYVC